MSGQLKALSDRSMGDASSPLRGGPGTARMQDDSGAGLFSPSSRIKDESKLVNEDMDEARKRANMRQDSSWNLPLEERSVQVPDHIIASVGFARDGDSRDIIQVGHNTFRGQGGRLPVEEGNRVRSNEEVIYAMNTHTYGARDGNKSIMGFLGRLGTCGLYWCVKRRVIPDGYWGHYMSQGRNMLTPSGLQMLWSPFESWTSDVIKIDDEEHLVRTLGGKIIVTVPENHLGGAFKVTSAKGVSKKIKYRAEHQNEIELTLQGKTSVEGDGDFRFVLFRSGRHVLDDCDYRDVTVVKLGSKPILKFGPLTILYVKEGQLGGAYAKNEGVYRMFPPGPPHILHEQNYDQIELVNHRLEPFRLGPLTFLTVSEGQLAGAFETGTGKFQLLPPNCVYKLHSKDYAGIQIQERKEVFRLGPFWFLTVRQGQLAGAYRKKGGQFQIFPPGFSYQLSDEEYEEPETLPKNKHVVRCGPFTFITCATGTLAGAYRIKDGQFVQFNKPNQEYILHDRDYHGLVIIPRYSAEVQQFGPFQVFTVAEGELGAVVDDGKIRIKSPGTYIIPKDTKLLPSIPMKTFTYNVEQPFTGKDTVEMIISATVTWKVESPDLVVLFPGGFQGAVKNMEQMVDRSLKRLGALYTREQLLPTPHLEALDNLLIKPNHPKNPSSNQNDTETVASMKMEEILKEIESKLADILRSTSSSAHWGFSLVPRVWGCALNDDHIKEDLQKIARIAMETESQAATAQLELAKFNCGKEVRMCQTLWRREALIKDAQADAEAAEVRAKSANDNLKAELEATKNMTKTQLELKQAELALKAMAEMGKAAWRCPDNMQQFFATFSRYLSVGGYPAHMMYNNMTAGNTQGFPLLPPASASAEPSSKPVQK